MQSTKNGDSSSEKDNHNKTDKTKHSPKDARLAAALRENLRKRKQQQRDRKEEKEKPSPTQSPEKE